MTARPAAAWRIGAHVVGLAPLAAAMLLASRHGLGVHPVETATLWTGRAAIAMLLLSLACTPARTYFGLRQAVGARRTLGLYAFTYAALHLLVFVGVDYGFDVALMRDDGLAKKPYIVAGTLSAAILTALAATSSRSAMRRMGRHWKRTHRLVYLAGGLAAVHFAWKVKALTAGPLLVAGVLGILLLARAPHVRRLVARGRVAAFRGPTSIDDP